MTPDAPDLVARLRAGDRRALARLITRVENGAPDAPDILRALHGTTGHGYVVGVTGPPGAGKSTLVDRLIHAYRQRGDAVGVVAVDPTSPFTGGAVLGDRVRMQAHTLDAGVFIRSMATRGSLGGVAHATGLVLKLLDAGGFPWLLVETVGVGQTELDVMKLADTTVVVLVPESGDAVQTMKAGLLEGADVFVVNKADREGAARLVTELRFMTHVHKEGQQAARDLDWEVPIVATEGTTGKGVDLLVAEIDRHRAALEATGALARRRAARRGRELRELVLAGLAGEVDAALAGRLAAMLDEVASGRLEPYTAAARVRAELSPGA